MPKHRQLDPAAPFSRAPHRPLRPGRFAVPGLAVAVALALGAAFAPGLQLLLAAAALLVALPALAAALLDPPSRAASADGTTAERPASTDTLTGTADESAWQTAIDAALLDAPSGPVSVARLAIDLPDDDADRLLIVSAVRWQEILRPGDTLARLGTAEFAILLPRCPMSAAEAVLGRLRAAVPDATPSHAAVVTWDGTETPTALDRRADAALRTSRRAATAATPLADPDRLAAVAATGLANRETTEEFDAVARSVAWMLGVPFVAITLFDAEWQHYVGTAGIVEAGGPADGLPARDAICRTTVETGQALVVSDTERHPVLREVPATTAYGIAACASVPVTGDGGHVLGSLCAMVDHRHQWTADEVNLLRLAARRIGARLTEQPAAATRTVAGAA